MKEIVVLSAFTILMVFHSNATTKTLKYLNPNTFHLLENIDSMSTDSIKAEIDQFLNTILNKIILAFNERDDKKTLILLQQFKADSTVINAYEKIMQELKKWGPLISNEQGEDIMRYLTERTSQFKIANPGIFSRMEKNPSLLKQVLNSFNLEGLN